tara:strand:- start:6634 stop:7329 length:696 start_codon:yes stop_codon:yes gene_type:complete
MSSHSILGNFRRQVQPDSPKLAALITPKPSKRSGVLTIDFKSVLFYGVIAVVIYVTMRKLSHFLTQRNQRQNNSEITNAPYTQTANAKEIDAIPQEGRVAVLIYSPMCGFSNQMMPIWDHAVASLREELQSHCYKSASRQLSTTLGIQEVPIIIAFENGEAQAYMKGVQSELNITTFLEANVGQTDAVEKLEPVEEEEEVVVDDADPGEDADDEESDEEEEEDEVVEISTA